MAIQYIVNDPFAAKSAPKMRQQPKRPNRLHLRQPET
jgi:hypothetical protein